jgi:ferredoxin-NADP reductase
MNLSTTHGELDVALVVLQSTMITPEIVELEFESADGASLPHWDAGAHFDLHLPSGKVRQYSLMRGTASKDNWRIAVHVDRDGRGGSLEIERDVEVGKIVKGVGPRNHFALREAHDYVFIAGGIGITPLIDMIDQVEQLNKTWVLHYLGRSRTTMAYLDLLTSRWGARVKVWARDEGERIDIASLAVQLHEYSQVYACGPERMLTAIENEITPVAPGRVHVERFHPREIPDEIPFQKFTVECERSGIEIEVDVDESIFMVADFAGIEVDGDCLEGTCGACETRVLSGDVIHRDSVLSQEARDSGESMMICVSRAKNSKLVLDL